MNKEKSGQILMCHLKIIIKTVQFKLFTKRHIFTYELLYYQTGGKRLFFPFFPLKDSSFG